MLNYGCGVVWLPPLIEGVEKLKRYDVVAYDEIIVGKDTNFRAPDVMAHNDAQARTWSLVASSLVLFCMWSDREVVEPQWGSSNVMRLTLILADREPP